MLDKAQHVLFSNEPIEAVQQFVGLGHQHLIGVFSLLADTWGILFVIGFTFWLWGRRAMYSMLGVIALGALTKAMMSKTFSASRPHGPDIVSYTDLEIGSFPSGHVYQVFTAWFWLYVRGHLRWFLPFLIGGLVAFSRVYLGAHYVGDVLFAFLFGLLFIWGYRYLWPWMADRLQHRSQLFFLILGILVSIGVGATLAYSYDNPRRWEILGITVGLTAGLLLEHRFLGYQPASVTKRWQAAKVALGTAGIILCYAADRLLFAPEAYLPGVFTAGVAALWVVLGAPALFRQWTERTKAKKAL